MALEVDDVERGSVCPREEEADRALRVRDRASGTARVQRLRLFGVRDVDDMNNTGLVDRIDNTAIGFGGRGHDWSWDHLWFRLERLVDLDATVASDHDPAVLDDERPRGASAHGREPHALLHAPVAAEPRDLELGD